MNLVKNVAFLFLVFLVSIFGCKEDIPEPKNISNEVLFVENSFFGDCYDIFVKDSLIVIRTNEQYQSLFRKYRPQPILEACFNVSPNEFDFEKYSLLGAYTAGEGCVAIYNREMIKRGSDSMTYNIRVNYAGSCNDTLHEMNWALVPKLKKRTVVVFTVSEK